MNELTSSLRFALVMPDSHTMHIATTGSIMVRTIYRSIMTRKQSMSAQYVWRGFWTETMFACLKIKTATTCFI